MIATCWNFLEAEDNLSYESLLPLLLEEYQPEEIEAFKKETIDCIAQVMLEFEFKERVLQEYDQLELSIHADKATVMRTLSRHFRRQEMKKVYAIIIWNR